MDWRIGWDYANGSRGVVVLKNLFYFYFFNTIFVSGHIHPENTEGTRVIVGSMNMGYDIYLTLLAFELTTCSVTSAHQFL